MRREVGRGQKSTRLRIQYHIGPHFCLCTRAGAAAAAVVVLVVASDAGAIATAVVGGGSIGIVLSMRKN